RIRPLASNATMPGGTAWASPCRRWKMCSWKSSAIRWTKTGPTTKTMMTRLRWREHHEYDDGVPARGEGIVRLRRAQLQPDQALLHLGDRLHGLQCGTGAVDPVYRRLHGRRPGGDQGAGPGPRDPVPVDRGAGVELPEHGLRDHQRDDHVGALGGDHRVHA